MALNWIYCINQGRSAAGLDWDGLGALGHGVPVLGDDGYEYVGWEQSEKLKIMQISKKNCEFFLIEFGFSDSIWIN